MKAIIMAGGLGSRLAPLTNHIPKPMVSLMNEPVMAYSVQWLAQHGVRELGATLQFLPEVIQSHFARNPMGANWHYFHEEQPLGTAGSVKNAQEFLTETFFVISGDALCDFDLSLALAFHKEKKSIATLLLKRVAVPLEYGTIVTDSNGRIQRFIEKPSWSEVFSDTVNTGIYILEPQVLDDIPNGRFCDFSRDIFPLLLEKQTPMFGYVADGYWCDIGDLAQYRQAHRDVLDGKIKLQLKAKEILPGIWLEPGAQVKQGSIQGPCYIASHSVVGQDCRIGPYSVVGSGCRLEDHASIADAILWDHCHLKGNSHVDGAVLCSRVHMDHHAYVYDGSAVGMDILLQAEQKIGPNQRIDASPVAESSYARRMFGTQGIALSKANALDECIAVAHAYAKILPKSALIAISARLPSHMSIQYAALSALTAHGLQVLVIDPLCLPQMRFCVSMMDLDGGLFIGEHQGHHFIQCLSAQGADLTNIQERKIETLLSFNPDADHPGEIIHPYTIHHILPLYKRFITKRFPPAPSDPLLLAGYGEATGKEILDDILSAYQCQIRWAHSEEEMAASLTRENYAFGFALHPSAIGISLYFQNRKPITPDQLHMLICLLYCLDEETRQFDLPIGAPGVIEQIAAAHQKQVIRCSQYKQLNPCPGRQRDGMPNLYHDGIAVIAAIISYLQKSHMSLDELLALLPHSYTASRLVDCEWIDKGRVLRTLSEQLSSETSLLPQIEGLCFSHQNSRVWIWPHPDQTTCQVQAESDRYEFAEEICSFYSQKIRDILDSKE